MPRTLDLEIDETSDRVAETIGALDDREAALLRELAAVRAARERYAERIRRALAPKDVGADPIMP